MLFVGVALLPEIPWHWTSFQCKSNGFPCDRYWLLLFSIQTPPARAFNWMISSTNFQLLAGFRLTYGMQPYVLAWMFITLFVCNIFQAWSFNWDSVVFLMLLWRGCLCVAHSATFVDDCQLTTNVAEFFGAVLYLFFRCCLITYLFCFMLLSLQLVSAATVLQTLSTMEKNAQVNGGWMSGLFHFCQHESI
jgi:hypothetical protein